LYACAYNQGDQSGRIFAYWAVVYFGLLLENDKSGANYWATFCHGTIFVLSPVKNGLGYIFGDSFTGYSGHPAYDLPCARQWQ
jgi:hypothetical protein